MADIGIGLIGCGWVAVEKHVVALRAVPGVELVAVADPDAGALAAFAQLAPAARTYPDADALLADPAVAAVGVLTPARTHTEVALAVLRSDRPVLVEKPLALSAHEALAIEEEAATRGLIGATAFNLRGHPVVVAARAALAAGQIGRVTAIRTLYGDAILDSPRGAPEWRRTRAQGGGVALEKLVHHVDLWRHLTGSEVAEIRALTVASATADDEVVGLVATLEDGTLATALGLDRSATANEAELLGTGGRLELDLYRADGLRHHALDEVAGDPRVRGRRAAQAAKQLPAVVAGLRGAGAYDSSYAAEWAAFRDALVHGAAPLATLADGRRATEILDAAFSSAGNVTVR